MKALTWQGTRKVTVEEVPDPRLQHPTDTIVQITSSAIGSALFGYTKLYGKIPGGQADLVTHHAPLSDAPESYDTFQKKTDGCIKVVLQPGRA